MSYVQYTYDRNINYLNASQISRNEKAYNPEIKMYYNSRKELIKIEETFAGKSFVKYVGGTTLDGSEIDQTVAYYVVHSPWEVA